MQGLWTADFVGDIIFSPNTVETIKFASNIGQMMAKELALPTQPKSVTLMAPLLLSLRRLGRCAFNVAQLIAPY